MLGVQCAGGWYLGKKGQIPIDMCSISRFFQSVMLILFIVFQFMRIVFLAMVRAIESILLDVLFRLMFGVSPSRQGVGDSGMWKPKREKRLSVMSRQNC